MNNLSVRPAVVFVALMLGLATLAGCSQDPQEKYDDAVEQLKEARESRNDAQEKVQSKKDELKELQADLNEAEATLQSARDEVEAAAQAIDKTVSDQVLFRTIQRDVLNEDNFDEAAISVSVNNRVVTLTGSVPDEETRERALKQAREQAGVKDVVDELEIDNGESQPEKPAPKPDEKNAQQPKNEQSAPEKQKPADSQPAQQPEGNKAQPNTGNDQPAGQAQGQPQNQSQAPDNAQGGKPNAGQPQPGQNGGGDAAANDELPVPPAERQSGES